MRTELLRVIAIEDALTDGRPLRARLDGLGSWDVHVRSCPSAELALSLWKEKPHDLVIVDFEEEQTDGIDVLSYLLDWDPQMPVMVLTPFHDPDWTVRALGTGASSVIVKGELEQEDFEVAIDRIAEQSKERLWLIEARASLEEVNRSLVRQTKNLQEFHHEFAHELKNPLTVTKEFLSMLLQELAGPLNDQQQEYLQIARESCERMITCVRDLLDASRLETGKVPIDPYPASLSPIIEKTVMAMQPLAQEEELHLSSNLPLDMPDGVIDPERITQILTNLLTNAIKFTPSRGEITVCCDDGQLNPGFLTISVQDTGRGIDRANLEEIFEPYYQTSNDSKAKGGLGLGLNICRQLVRLHGGDIWVESEVGTGTIFFFTVPQYAGKPAPV